MECSDPARSEVDADGVVLLDRHHDHYRSHSVNIGEHSKASSGHHLDVLLGQH